ncbi:MAG TPA: nodulation protein NodN [Cellvibrionales bacterium]|jgi:acyl dehydratase|nr:MaoC family dehydratase [Pseudomonadales bacterium]HAB54983.1 nodulation protein NodN [Cellvibrionales bacterium]
MTTTIKAAEVADYIGFEAEATDWHTVTQEQINQFADCTLDHQFIHTDPVKAKETQFGSTIAHGFLSVSLLSHFAEQYSVVIDGCYMGINYGFDSLRFVSPVKVDSRIRARAKYLEIEEKKTGQYQFKVAVTIEIEGSERPALVCEWLSLQRVR